MKEDKLKQIIEQKLKEEGFTGINVRYGQEHGSDVEALFPGSRRRLLMEVKGETEAMMAKEAPQAQWIHYVESGIFELLSRMEEERAVYALALPDTQKYRSILMKLPLLARRRLKLHTLFVSEDRIVYLPPDEVNPYPIRSLRKLEEVQERLEGA